MKAQPFSCYKSVYHFHSVALSQTVPSFFQPAVFSLCHLHAAHILSSIYSSPCPFIFLLFSPSSSSFTSPSSSVSFLLSSLSVHRPPSPSSAHVDMSTVAFDVDPLDLDAEELPDSQGDPRSSKGMSGSVTSPQANAHRLPFFKKVTLGAQDAIIPPPPRVCPSLLQDVVRSIV